MVTTLNGTAASDTLIPSDLNTDHVVYGNAGNDYIRSYHGNDTIFGGDGNDYITLWKASSNFVDAGSGNDRVISAAVNLDSTDTFKGGLGTDTLDIAFNSDNNIATNALDNMSGFEKIQFSGATGNISTLIVSDSMASSSDTGRIEVLAGSNNITIGTTGIAEGSPEVRVLSSGTITLADGFDTSITLDLSGAGSSVVGGTGNDYVRSYKGTDTIQTGAGNDTVSSWKASTDSVDLGAGDDEFHIAAINFEAGDTVVGGTGNDTLQLTFVGSGHGVATIDAAAFANVSGIDTLKIHEGSVSGDYEVTISDAMVTSTDNSLLKYDAGNTTSVLNTGGVRSTSPYHHVSVISSGTVMLKDGANNRITTDITHTVNAHIIGGDGHDYIRSYGGSDSLIGGAGNDYFTLSTYGTTGGGDTVRGGDGIDTVSINAGNFDSADLFEGGAGNDRLILLGNVNLSSTDFASVSGFERIDLVKATSIEMALASNITDLGGELVIQRFNSSIKSLDVSDMDASQKVTLEGTEKVQLSNNGGTVFAADSFNTLIYGGSGQDEIQGGNGDDQFFGGAGQDTLSGGEGSDLILGGDGNDSLYGGKQFDYLDGGNGADTIFAGQDADVVNGQDGDDLIYGDLGDDYLDGGKHNDVIYGGEGNDQLIGRFGNDTLVGGLGADSFEGGAGEDVYLIDLSKDLGQGADSYINFSGLDQFGFTGGILTSASGNSSLDFADGTASGAISVTRTTHDIGSTQFNLSSAESFLFDFSGSLSGTNFLNAASIDSAKTTLANGLIGTSSTSDLLFVVYDDAAQQNAALFSYAESGGAGISTDELTHVATFSSSAGSSFAIAGDLGTDTFVDFG